MTNDRYRPRIVPGVRGEPAGLNTDLLTRTLHHCETDRTHWRQSSWISTGECGTAYCYATRAALLAGYTVDGDGDVPRYELPDDFDAVLIGDWPAARGFIHVAVVARWVLGLNQVQANELFASDNTIEDLQRIVAELCAAAPRRQAPPNLEFTTPACSVCGRSTDSDGDSIWCENCGSTWASDGEDGEWSDPDAPQCPSRYVIRPDDTAVFRCQLDDGHIDDGITLHYNGTGFMSWTQDEALPIKPAAVAAATTGGTP